MQRYVVERTFPEGLHIPIENGGADALRWGRRAQRRGRRDLDQLLRLGGQDPHVLRL